MLTYGLSGGNRSEAASRMPMPLEERGYGSISMGGGCHAAVDGSPYDFYDMQNSMHSVRGWGGVGGGGAAVGHALGGMGLRAGEMGMRRGGGGEYHSMGGYGGDRARGGGGGGHPLGGGDYLQHQMMRGEADINGGLSEIDSVRRRSGRTYTSEVCCELNLYAGKKLNLYAN
jgi:hypothetical protein